eukprot:CAMPEP_0177719710 /NCGR_PEP_ID=MMETSP0484_2-20121128/16249_1 /TAXON_ID=354590 /ORGANISM="Rhodomonas lens, Strain RHODO" /LENGTH=30 /DNA_ID= /DNA_START= /DNA_END= /DNA_ORIENTATION=
MTDEPPSLHTPAHLSTPKSTRASASSACVL